MRWSSGNTQGTVLVNGSNCEVEHPVTASVNGSNCELGLPEKNNSTHDVVPAGNDSENPPPGIARGGGSNSGGAKGNFELLLVLESALATLPGKM